MYYIINTVHRFSLFYKTFSNKSSEISDSTERIFFLNHGSSSLRGETTLKSFSPLMQPTKLVPHQGKF